MEKQSQMKSILESFRVLDLTDEKGFLSGKILADMGAEVIKIEKPGGDRSRSIGPFYQNTPHPEKSIHWFAYNVNKRGITLNIESRDGQQLFGQLVEKAEGRRTVPQIFIDDKPIGGFTDLRALDQNGQLAEMISG